MSWKRDDYAKWAPPKKEIKRIENYTGRARQSAQRPTGKPKISVVFIGNVDAGKSTTSGHLIAKCNGISKHQLATMEKEAAKIGKTSFKYAWIMDGLKDERERGLSIDLALWTIKTEKYDVDLIDAPGHKDFVKNMASGASLADAAVLLVDASPGHFEEGLKKDGNMKGELQMAFTLGVTNFIVCINKMDTINYDQKRYQEVLTETMRCMKRIGIKVPRCIFIPVSSWVGENLTVPTTKMPWYKGWSTTKRGGDIVKGKTLLEAINSINTHERAISMPLKIPILMLHKIGGVGTVAVGRVASGTLKAGEEICICPLGDKPWKVGAIEINHSNISEAYPGDLVGFNVKGLGPRTYARGAVAYKPSEGPLPQVRRFLAQVVIVSHKNIKEGYLPYFFAHTASFPCKFAKLVARIDKRTGKVIEKDPKSLKTGDAANVIMEPTNAQALQPYKDFPPLGRFVVRDQSEVVAFGLVREILEFKEQRGPRKKISTKSKYLR